MMDDRFEPSGAPCRSSSHRLPERLSKNAAPAIGISAAKSADRDAHLNRAALRRQIQKPPLIAAVHSLGLVPAVGPPASTGTTSGGDQNEIGPEPNLVDHQTPRQRSK